MHRQIRRDCSIVDDLWCFFDTGSVRLDVPEPEPKKPFATRYRDRFDCNDKLDEAITEQELDSLITAVNKTNIDLSKPDIIERLEDRDDSEHAPVSYSWVDLNEFRLFELHTRCFAWASPNDLRDVVDRIP